MINSTKTSLPQAMASHAPVPEEFYCPISCAVMREPVTTEHGQVFERAWIAAVIGSGKSCPLTRKPFVTGRLVENTRIKNAIAAHPEAFAEANQADEPPAMNPPDSFRARPFAGTPSAPTEGRHLDSRPTPSQFPASVALREGRHLPLLLNVAGRAHAKLSRKNLLREIEAAEQQLRGMESRGAPLYARIELVGRISKLQMYLKFARVASVVTVPADAILGSYTRSEHGDNDDIRNWLRLGVVGAAGSSCALIAPIVGTVTLPLGEGASLLGASIKGTVRLAAQGPAMIASARARRKYERTAGLPSR